LPFDRDNGSRRVMPASGTSTGREVDSLACETSTDVVVLDFDGTILDSMPFLTDLAASLLASRYGMGREDARRAYVETTGLPFEKQIEIIAPADARNQSTVKAFEEGKRRRMMRFELFPDVVPAVRELRQNGIRVCVSSGNYEELINRFLHVRGLEVDLVMGYRPGFEKGRDHFEFAGRTLGCSFDRMVFVGDSRRDWLSADTLGIRFIARAGLHTARELQALLPGVPVIDSLDQALPILGIRKAPEDSGAGTSSKTS
jgi:phosphoglycolate phosphatase-like HAD superfamily hydrolase